MSKEIFSLELEKQVIAGLLKNPDYYFQNEINSFLCEDDFYNAAHQTIFSVILNLIKNNEHVNKEVVAQKIKDIGITLEVPAFDYLRALNVLNVSKEGFCSCVKELKKLWVRRKIKQDSLNCAKAMESAGNASFNEILAIAGKFNNDTINLGDKTNQPRDLFKGSKELIESIGNNPQENGLNGPYPKFQKLFGSYTKGDVYVFCALYGVGKSTIIDDVLLKVCTVCNPDKDVKGLILDTELETERVQFRKIGSKAGISPYLLRTGKWRLNETTVKKVRDVLDDIESLEGKLDHIYVGNMTLEEQCSVARRWAAQKRAENPDVELIIAFDYIKISEGVDDSNKEYQIIGAKVNTFKQLATELKVPFITGLQLNRQNDLAMSQRVGWYASYLFKLRNKTDEEMTLFPDHGNCVLETDKTREWGEEGHSINKLVSYQNLRQETVTCKNYLNLNIKNFDVQEIGTAEDMLTIKLIAAASTTDDGALLDD